MSISVRMMRKRIFIVQSPISLINFFCIVCFFLLTSIVTSKTTDQKKIPTEEALVYLRSIQFVPETEGLSIDTLTMEVTPRKPRTITSTQAVIDVNRLFDLFRHGYSGHGFFSKKYDFSIVKEELLKDIQIQAQWSPSEFSRLLRRHLDFIQDIHLKIGRITYGTHQAFWTIPNLEFQKAEDQWFLIGEDRKELMAVNEKDPDGYMFPSLNKKGDKIFRIGILSAVQPEKFSIKLKDRNSMETLRTLTLNCSDFNHYSDKIFHEDNIGGIPVIRIRSFTDNRGEDLQRFIKTAEKYQRTPCIIIDVRGNGGGNERWPSARIETFSGERPEINRYFIELVSLTTMMGRFNYFAWLLHRYPDNEFYQSENDRYLSKAREFENLPPYWTGPYYGSDLIFNDTRVIVITNGKVASAGEGFLIYISQMENVCIVGENTMGALGFGQISYHRLPHSKLLIRLPISLNVAVDLKFREEKGYSPDFWVPAEYAVDYAVAAVKKGTIPTVMPLTPEMQDPVFKPENRFILTGKKILILLAGLVAGFVFVIANKSRRTVFFFASAAVCGGLGIIFQIIDSLIVFGIAGYVFWCLVMGTVKVIQNKTK